MNNMNKNIKVLIQGTGFAGQGHAEAFRYVGAEVVGIVGRTESVVQQVAKDLKIAYAGTDWQQALIDCKPDVVSIATPGGAHKEAIQQAIEFGCHVFSDKPLTESGETAQKLYELAVDKNVKTAFAASFRYMPDVIHAKRLVEEGAIGEPLEDFNVICWMTLPEALKKLIRGSHRWAIQQYIENKEKNALPE